MACYVHNISVKREVSILYVVLMACYVHNISVKREVSAGDYVDSVMRVEFIPILPTSSKLQ